MKEYLKLRESEEGFELVGDVAVRFGHGAEQNVYFCLKFDKKWKLDWDSKVVEDITGIERNFFSLEGGKVWKLADNKLINVLDGEIKEFDNKNYLDKLFNLPTNYPTDMTEAQAVDFVDKLIDIANHIGPQYYPYLNQYLKIDHLVKQDMFKHLEWKYLLSTSSEDGQNN